jgi:hypothetical protein
MRRVFTACVTASCLIGSSAFAQQPAASAAAGQAAIPCPSGMPQCVVIFMPPQALSWLAGTMPSAGSPATGGTAKDSILDLAAKSIGADGSAVIAQVLLYLRAAQPGAPPTAGEPLK